MYSLAWFETFADTVPGDVADLELASVERLAPPDVYPRLLDIGCGTGRCTARLVAAGYRVTGIDVSVEAAAVARTRAPAAELVILDQRDVGRLGRRFDVAIVLWNSIGFGTRTDDLATLRGIAGVLRRGGLLLLDLYHPGWLATHELRQSRDPRGATIDRWVQDGRCVHRIEYATGGLDEIAFNVYQPAEMNDLLGMAGFEPGASMAWWEPATTAGPEHARYQLAGRRGPLASVPGTPD